MERERSHFISMSNSSKLNQHESGSSLPKLKGKTILFVGSYPPPYGGVSSLLAGLGKSFESVGCKYHVLHFYGKTEPSEKIDGAIVHRIKNKAVLPLLLSFFLKPIRTCRIILVWLTHFIKSPNFFTSSIFLALNVSKIADKVRAESVTIFTTRYGALIPFLRILNPCLPIYYCIFADPYKNPDFYDRYNHWFRKAMLSSNKVFSSSAYCANAVRFFAPELVPHYIYIGVDTKRFNPANDLVTSRSKIGIPQDKPVVLFVGRMEPEMGAGNAHEIAEKVISRNKNIIFILAGAKGSLTKNIESIADRNKGKIYCRVNVPFEDLPYYYNACTILIAPTLGVHACMGVTIKEAMASGKPTVVSDSGGIPEAIQHGIEGEIVPLDKNGNIDNMEFVKTIEVLLNDEARCKQYGYNARKRALEIFSLESTSEGYAKLLNGEI